MKKIFITIPWFIPAFKAGGPIQSIANMVYALDKGFEFYIYTSNTDLHGLPIAVSLTNEWVKYNDHTKVWYATKKNRSQNLVDQVKLIRPDIVYIIGLFDWHFNIVPMLYAECSRKIISVRGMLHPGALSQKSFKKKIFLQFLQWMKAGKKYFFHATDEAEEIFIRDVFKDAEKIAVAGNFPRLFPVQEPAEKNPGTLRLISVGIISPMKNYLTVIEALQQTTGNIHYDIYGPVKEPAYWEACLEAMKQLPSNIIVQYHPELPAHKVASKLNGQHVFILPSKSENFGHAIVEALSAGLPVITSNDVPWTGLRENNAGINTTADVLSLKEAIYFFETMDNETYHKYCSGAATYIRNKTDVEALKAAYRNMF